MLIDCLTPFNDLRKHLSLLQFPDGKTESAELGVNCVQNLEKSRAAIASISSSRSPVTAEGFIAAIDDKGEHAGSAQCFNKMIELAEGFKKIIRDATPEKVNRNFIIEKSKEGLKLLFEGMQKLIIGPREGGLPA